LRVVVCTTTTEARTRRRLRGERATAANAKLSAGVSPCGLSPLIKTAAAAATKTPKSALKAGLLQFRSCQGNETASHNLASCNNRPATFARMTRVCGAPLKFQVRAARFQVDGRRPPRFGRHLAAAGRTGGGTQPSNEDKGRKGISFVRRLDASMSTRSPKSPC
jgi:hypothetical protein